MRRSIDTFLHLPRRRVFSALELHAVLIGTIAAAVFLIGYGFDFKPLQTLLPGFPAMQPVTAAIMMLLSLSCLLSLRGSRRLEWLSSAIAAGIVIYLVYQNVTHFNTPSYTIARFRSIMGTTLSVVLASVAMIIINLAPRWGVAVGVIAFTAAAPALYRILGLLLFWGAPQDQASPLNSMGLHTAFLIVWFMSACVLMHPRLGFGAALLEPSLRGRLLRRALPVVVLLPPFAGALGLVLSLTFGWTNEVLFALMATVSVTLGASLIWWLSNIVARWQTDANAHAGRLSRANEALEQYASSAAHDLKAPARHVLLYGELLDEALARGDIETARRHARNIHDSAAELPPMIEGMLEFSRSANTQIGLGEASLSELVSSASALQAEDIKAAGATLTVAHEAKLACDVKLMTAVFQNLIANSLKNRRKDRALAIRIDAECNDRAWEISVEDNGVGFDPEFASVAFNPLARGVARAGEGGGIGLATCRTIVQGHGGEIRVDPTFRGGARIEFTLPVK